MPKGRTRERTLLETAKSQLNVRVSVVLKDELNNYLTFMKREKLPSRAADWPMTIQEVIDEALHQFLAEHSPTARPPSKPLSDFKPKNNQQERISE